MITRRHWTRPRTSGQIDNLSRRRWSLRRRALKRRGWCGGLMLFPKPLSFCSRSLYRRRRTGPSARVRGARNRDRAHRPILIATLCPYLPTCVLIRSSLVEHDRRDRQHLLLLYLRPRPRLCQSVRFDRRVRYLCLGLKLLLHHFLRLCSRLLLTQGLRLGWPQMRLRLDLGPTGNFSSFRPTGSPCLFESGLRLGMFRCPRIVLRRIWLHVHRLGLWLRDLLRML